MLLFFFPKRSEVPAALLVLFDPLSRKAAVLNARKDFLHRFAGFVASYALATREVAILGRVRNRVAHAAESAFINEVDNQLHFVAALEIGDLGRVAGFDQRLESFLDQRREPAAENRLLAEQIALRFLAESRTQHAGARRTDAVRVGKCVVLGAAAGILVNRQQRGYPAALLVHATQQVA